jgi:hypothetical protein
MMVNVGIGVYYHLNKEYITSQLCINKSNPSLHCGGHCYLVKQLKKAEQKEKQSAQIFKGTDQIITNYSCGNAFFYFPQYTLSNFGVYSEFRFSADNRNALIKPPLG